MKRTLTITAAVIFFIMLLSSCKTNQGPLAATNFDGLNGPVLNIGNGLISINNWEVNPYSTVNPSNETLSLNTTNAACIEEGTGSAEIYCNPLAYQKPITLYKVFSPDTNLSNRIVSIWIYVPPALSNLNGSYFLNLYATVDGGGDKEIYSSNQFSTGWTQIKFTVPNSDEYTYISAMRFSLEAIANLTPTPFTGYIYFDEISW
jgi:hypothetical protein